MKSQIARSASAVLTIAVALTLVACGSGNDNKSQTTATKKPVAAKPTELQITTSDLARGRFKTQAPPSIRGGLVRIDFRNTGKMPHEAQLIRVDSGHTVQRAVKILAGDMPKIPDWIHGAGGVAAIPPGSADTTVNLAPGHYAVVDMSSDNGPPPSARGALAEFDVTAGPTGALPAHTATVIAKTVGKDMYRFDISGLKAGANRILFDNRSKGQLHHVITAPIKPGKTLADVKKFLSQQGKPSGPPPVDFPKITGTSVIDGGNSEVTTLNLAKPGKYVVLCFLNDRDGGKPHFMEGMLKQIVVR